jgi:hypothetical protein
MMATLVARNANEQGYGVAFGGVRRSVLCWYVWQERGFSSREDVSTFKVDLRTFINVASSLRSAKITKQFTSIKSDRSHSAISQ